MIEIGVQDRMKLEEYLQLLRLLAFELERAMGAIAQNSLSALEDSVANQQAFSTRIGELAQDLGKTVKARGSACPNLTDEGLMGQIRAANDSLQSLNRRYSALLKLSSHSVALMVSLFSSYQGQIRRVLAPG